MALSPNSEPFSYGGVGILAVISIALIILGFYLQNHSIHIGIPFINTRHRKSHYYMPKSPFHIIVSTILGFASIVGLVLALQGFCAHFSRDFPLPYAGYTLFNIIDMPTNLRGITLWATRLGKTTWIAPSLMLVGSIWLFNYSRFGNIVSMVLVKMRP